MSWIDKIDRPFKIITGDGLEYLPYWMNAKKAIEFNVSEFNFPDVEGTYVDRKLSKGRKIPLEFYFQSDGRVGSQNAGTDHLVEAELFEQSSKDSRPWTIDHPFYGIILVQPVSLDFDNTSLNVTKITGTVIETITNTPKTNLDPVDNSKFLKSQMDEVVATSFATSVPEPSIEVTQALLGNVDAVYKEGAKKVKETTDAQEYFNLFNEANTAIVNATEDVLAAIRTANAVINAPFQFIDSVRNRIDIIRTQFTTLVEAAFNLVTPQEKKVFESNAITSVSAMTQAAIIETDYDNRVQVVTVIDQIITDYNLLIETLDELQTENGGEEDSYIPDAQSIIQLSNLVNFTVANLFIISLTAKQERTLILEDDTNVVMLAHRLYGLQVDDSTIQRIINDNSIGLNEYLGIRKGRKIIYYV